MYPETGHSPHWERPERFAADLEASCEQADRPPDHHDAPGALGRRGGKLSGLIPLTEREASTDRGFFWLPWAWTWWRIDDSQARWRRGGDADDSGAGGSV